MSESDEPQSNEALEALREKIDAVDRQLVELINQRAQHVVEVGNLKRGSNVPIYAPHREAAVLKKIQSFNEGPIHDRTLEAVYRELMSGSLRSNNRCGLAISAPSERSVIWPRPNNSVPVSRLKICVK